MKSSESSYGGESQARSVSDVGRFQLLNQRARFGCVFTFRSEAKILFILSLRPLRLVQSQQDVSSEQVRFSKVRFQLQRAADRRAGLHHLALFPVQPAQRKVSVPVLILQLESFEQGLL